MCYNINCYCLLWIIWLKLSVKARYSMPPLNIQLGLTYVIDWKTSILRACRDKAFFTICYCTCTCPIFVFLAIKGCVKLWVEAIIFVWSAVFLVFPPRWFLHSIDISRLNWEPACMALHQIDGLLDLPPLVLASLGHYMKTNNEIHQIQPTCFSVTQVRHIWDETRHFSGRNVLLNVTKLCLLNVKHISMITDIFGNLKFL